MVVQELIAKLGFDVDQGGLNSVDQALGNFAKKLTIAAAGIYAVKKAVEATVWAISGSIEAAAQKEDVTTQFKVMLGDLEAAKYLYQEINQYAAVSPFETAGLAENVKLMMSFGMSAKDAFDDLKKLGDVALGDQNKMNHIALAYAQTRAAGRLTGNDLLQYINAGFNPLEYIAQKTGKSADYWKKEMSKGKVSFDMVRQAFIDATSEGGKFYKGAEEGSKTWNGMLSTLRDNIRMLGAELGERVLPFVKDILRAFFELWPLVAGSFRAMADFFGIMAEDGPEATDWAITFAAALSTVASVLEAIGLAFYTIWVAMRGINALIAPFIGLFLDGLDLLTQRLFGLPILFGKLAKGLNYIMMQVGKITGNKEMEASARAGMLSADAGTGNYDTFGYTKQATGKAWGDYAGSLDKWGRMWNKLGSESAGAGDLKASEDTKRRLAGAAGKQPVTINNQTNNLTINADDPIKSMGEAAAGRFFQSAFIQLRHATV